MNINDQKIDELLAEIEDVRRRKIVDYKSMKDLPLIDPFKNINKTKSGNNNLIIGRRGCGKTSLLIKTISEIPNGLPIVFDCQPIKTDSFSQLVIKILSRITEEILQEYNDEIYSTHKLNMRNTFPFYLPLRRFKKQNKKLLEKNQALNDLRKLTNYIRNIVVEISSFPDNWEIVETTNQYEKIESSSQVNVKASVNTDFNANLIQKTMHATLTTSASLMGEYNKKNTLSKEKKTTSTSTTTINKSEYLRKCLVDSLPVVFNQFYRLFNRKVYLILDDFYLISQSVQPFFIQFFHDISKQCENNSFCFKMSVLPYRVKTNPEGNFDFTYKDDFSVVRLEFDLSDLDTLKDYLLRIVCSIKPNLQLIPSDIQSLFNKDDVLRYAIIAAGGIPRDFLLIFSDLVNISRSEKSTTISKEAVYEVVKQMKDDKDQNIESDSDLSPDIIHKSIEQLVVDFLSKEKTNVFLYPQDLAKTHEELLRNLVNLRYIHLIKENISSETIKNKTFDAYLIDMSFYATGKRMPRDFDFREFWVKDDKQRLSQLHRSPIWSFDVDKIGFRK